MYKGIYSCHPLDYFFFFACTTKQHTQLFCCCFQSKAPSLPRPDFQPPEATTTGAHVTASLYVSSLETYWQLLPFLTLTHLYLVRPCIRWIIFCNNSVVVLSAISIVTEQSRGIMPPYPITKESPKAKNTNGLTTDLQPFFWACSPQNFFSQS